MVITGYKRVAEAKTKSKPLVVEPVAKDPKRPEWEDVTFRDFVAMEALKAFVGKFGVVSPVNVGSPSDSSYQLCRAAYLYADAFLEERARSAQKEQR